MLSDRIVKLCQETATVSLEYAKNPSESPTDIAKRLYGHCKPASKHDFLGVAWPPLSPTDLEQARQCGKWVPTQPSNFFLQIFHDALTTLDADHWVVRYLRL